MKNGLKKLEEYNESSDPMHLHSYKKIKKKAITEVNKLRLGLPKSLVFIAFSTGEWFLEKLQLNVENEFHWDKRSVLNQLENLQMEYPKEGILFIQKEHVYMIETSMGEVKMNRNTN